MTSVSPVTTASSASSSSPTTQKPEVTSDYQTFLEMLTVQMQNQDPLNPMDSSDYAVQLATFSGVEQQVQTNQLLENLAASMGRMGIADLASWVGMEGRSTQPVMYSGKPITVATEAATGAQTAVLQVLNKQGTVVYSGAVDPAKKQQEWDGKLSNGLMASEGESYSFVLKSFANEEVLATEDAAAYGRIVEARMGSGGTELVMASGATVKSTDITALRERSGS
ncbi:flagellar basal body rod modification protein [Rhodobacteraceae bacterium]|nr:flagellar basal body rod modification protein [Paracoccaceae bacterium]